MRRVILVAFIFNFQVLTLYFTSPSGSYKPRQPRASASRILIHYHVFLDEDKPAGSPIVQFEPIRQLPYQETMEVQAPLSQPMNSSMSPHVSQHQALQDFSAMIESFWPQPVASAFDICPEFMNQYLIIKNSCLPNYLEAKIPVSSGLNIPQWEEALQGYHDIQICEHLKFGWPVGYLKSDPPIAVHMNHKSAVEFPEQIKKFINTELSHNAILGPFQEPPFSPWSRISPLMTRPKKNSIDRRVIIDLSFPASFDVNSGINIKSVLGRDTTYTLPSISDLITKLQLEGQGAFIWKADLSRAYRQFRIDPVDAPLMCIKFQDQYYIDKCPAFGCRSSSSACQRAANALVYIMAQAGHFSIAYLDDFAGCANSYQDATEAFRHFMAVSKSLGLQLAENKCVQPATQVEWLGYSINSIDMTVSIPEDKLAEVIHECEHWIVRRRASKQMIQSLIGKLVHVSNCIPQARKFITRIIATLRCVGEDGWTFTSEEFTKDIQWFLHFASASNGVLLYNPQRDLFECECDSSLFAGGGAFQQFYYTWSYTPKHRQLFPSIHELEAVNLLITYKTFSPHIKSDNALVIIHTDNIASSYALESGRTKDSTLASCARELWLLAAQRSHHISIRHKPGASLEFVDALSRMLKDTSKAALVKEKVLRNSLVLLPPMLDSYKFFSSFL